MIIEEPRPGQPTRGSNKVGGISEACADDGNRPFLLRRPALPGFPPQNRQSHRRHEVEPGN